MSDEKFSPKAIVARETRDSKSLATEGGRITLVWTGGSVYALPTKRRPLRLLMDFCSTCGVVH